MSNSIDSKHGKLLAEIVVPSSSWKLQPEKQTPFKSDSEALSYLDSHNEPLYMHVPVNESDDTIRLCVSSREADVVFTINSTKFGGETALHYSHLKNLESTIRTLVKDSCDLSIKAL